MNESYKRLVIFSIFYTILLACQIAIAVVFGLYAFIDLMVMSFILAFGLLILVIAHLIETIFLSYLETENALRDVRTAHYIGWLICIIGGIIGCFISSFPQIFAAILSLIITSGLILCGTYLFPLIGQEKGFKPSTSPQVAISSLELLKQRLAKGEIDREEYLELKKLIGE